MSDLLYTDGLLPFCIREKNELGEPFQQWDGVTLCAGTWPLFDQETVQSGSSSQYVTVYGPRSRYCVKLNRFQLMDLYWNWKAFTTTLGCTPSDISISINTSGSEQIYWADSMEYVEGTGPYIDSIQSTGSQGQIQLGIYDFRPQTADDFDFTRNQQSTICNSESFSKSYVWWGMNYHEESQTTDFLTGDITSSSRDYNDGLYGSNGNSGFSLDFMGVGGFYISPHDSAFGDFIKISEDEYWMSPKIPYSLQFAENYGPGLNYIRGGASFNCLFSTDDWIRNLQADGTNGNHWESFPVSFKFSDGSIASGEKLMIVNVAKNYYRYLVGPDSGSNGQQATIYEGLSDHYSHSITENVHYLDGITWVDSTATFGCDVTFSSLPYLKIEVSDTFYY